LLLKKENREGKRFEKRQKKDYLFYLYLCICKKHNGERQNERERNFISNILPGFPNKNLDVESFGQQLVHNMNSNKFYHHIHKLVHKALDIFFEKERKEREKGKKLNKEKAREKEINEILLWCNCTYSE